MKSAQGFTLIELMVTVVIVAILGGIIAPNFSTFIKDNRLSGQINTLIGAIHYARGEAASRRTIVTICASSNGSSCNDSNNWETGWIIFSDGNNSGNAVIDGSDELILYQEALEGGNTLRESGFSFGTGKLHFNANGFLYASDPSSGTMTLCDDRGASEAKAIVVNISGTSRLATDDNNDGIFNDHDGSASNISCP
ncbi:MAG: GspH/FimT family pseudopilin [Motiliproteus sp.]|nr:GspH/FimT family pseudopilin [Motiliproteus sp.]MCW9051522.1 GspH/FimT family pseudopilin [Motiliproteus sp.]